MPLIAAAISVLIGNLLRSRTRVPHTRHVQLRVTRHAGNDFDNVSRRTRANCVSPCELENKSDAFDPERDPSY